MNKRILSFLIAFSALVLTGIYVSGCQVGLGEAVDTQPPKLAINEEPKTGYVFRGQFTLSGTSSDETSLAGVTLTFKNLSNGVTYETKPAEVDLVEGTWNYVANKPLTKKNEQGVDEVILDDNGNPTYEYPDGQYEVKVVATDNAGRSQEQRKTYVIDNTAPILVLTRPSTNSFTEGGKIDVNSTDTYGQEFSVTGQTADDNAIDKMIVEVYDINDNLKTTIVKENIPPTVDLALATYDATGEKPGDYEKIYDSDNLEDRTQYFYCKITIFDEARPYPCKAGSEEDVGNSRVIYCLYNDIYKSILSKYKTSEIYHMLNGLYETDGAALGISRAGNKASKEDQEMIRSKFNGKEASKGTFSLNPTNNPTFSVTGYDPVSGTPSEKYEALSKVPVGGTEPAAALPLGSQIIVKMSAGLDKATIVKESLGIYLAEYKKNGSGEYFIDDANKIWLIKPLKYELKNADGTPKRDYPIAESEEEKTARNAIEAVGSYDYTATISLNLDRGVVTNTAYAVGVVGYDESDGSKEFQVGETPAYNYGVFVTSSGSAPVLRITAPSTGYIYANKESSISLNGTITAEDQTVITLKVLNEENASADDADYSIPVEGISYTTEKSSSSNEVWGPLTIPVSEMKKYFDQENSGTYTVTIVASAGARTADKTITVYYDVEAPIIDGPTVQPLVNENDRTDNVNGKVTVTARLSDSFTRIYTSGADLADEGDSKISKPELTIWDKAGNQIGEIIYRSATTIKETIDTTSFEDKQEITFRVRAYDIAGNMAEATETVYLDQDTDKPVVSLTNTFTTYTAEDGTVYNYTDPAGYPGGAKNILMAGAPITATIKDDDGLKSVAVTIKDSEGTVVSTQTYDSEAKDKNLLISSNPWPFSYSVPTKTAAYTMTFVVVDTTGVSTTVGPYWFKVDTGNPTIYVSPGNYYGKAGGVIKVSGTANGIGGLKVYSNYKAGTEITGTQADSEATSHSWLDYFAVAADVEESETGTTNTYSLIDSEGREGTATLTYFVDNTAPEVEISPLSSSVISSNACKFSGSASDTKGKINSLVDKIYYQVVEAGSSAPTLDDMSGWESFDATGSWSLYLNFIEKGMVKGADSDYEEGSYVLYVCAFDSAQNASAIEHQEFTVDLSNPTVETWYSTGADYKVLADATELAVQSAYTFAFTVKDTFGLDETDPYSIILMKDGNTLDAADYTVTPGQSITVMNELAGTTKIVDDCYVITVLQDEGKAGKGDGTFTYKITAKDKTAKTTQVSRNITRDTEAPSIEIISPEVDEWRSTANVLVKGSASDVSGINAVYYSRTTDNPVDAGDGALVKANWTAKGWDVVSGTTSWNKQFNSLEQGHTTVYYAAVDKYGNVSSVVSRDICVDLAAPKINKTTYSTEYIQNQTISVNGQAIVRSGIKFGGNVTDTYGVDSITITAQKDDVTRTVYSETGISGDGSIKGDIKNVYEWKQADYVPTDNSGDNAIYEGEWLISQIVVDLAGKTTVETFSLVLDKTAPSISNGKLFNNAIDAYAWNKIARGAISATVTDGGSGVSSVSYLYSSTPIAEADVESQRFDNVMNGSNGTYSVLNTFNEGSNYVYIKAEDKAGNVAYFGKDSSFLCNVDTVKPGVTFISPTGGTEISDNYDLNVILSVSDETSKLKEAMGGKIIVSSTDGKGDYAYTFNLPIDGSDSLPVVIPQAQITGRDNPKLTVTVNDNAGNITTEAISVTMDRDPPVITINKPVEGNSVNGNIVVAGITKDPNSSVKTVKIYREKLTGESADYTVTSGTWQGEYILMKEFNDTAVYNWTTDSWDSSSFDGVDVTFYVEATDPAGNVGYQGRTVSIDQDADRPVITVSNADLSSMTNAYNLVHQENELRGTVTDDDGVTGLYIKNGVDVDWGGNLYSSGSWTYSPLSDGDNKLIFKVIDSTGRTFISSGSDIISSPKVTDKKGTQLGYKGGAVKDTQLYLAVDLQNPTIGVKVNNTTPAASYNEELTAPFAYTLGDDYKLETVEIAVKKDGVTLTSGTDYDVSNSTDTATSKVGTVTITGAAGDGTYVYTINVIDGAGKKASSTTTFVLDTKAPVITVTSPADNEWQNKKTVTIRGTGEDASGISKVYYIQSATPTVPSSKAEALTVANWTGNGWTALSGLTSWNFTTPSTINEGATRYSFAAVDIYGNYNTTPVAYNLYVDTTAPVVDSCSWTKSGSSAVALKNNSRFTTNDGFSLAASVSDSYQLASISVELSKDGASTKSYSPTITGKKSYNWSHSFVVGSGNSASNDYLEDGEWTISITVTDVSDKTTIYTYSAVIDTIAPSITSVTTDWSAYSGSPSTNGYYSYTTPTVVAVASDAGSGVVGAYCLSSQTHYTTEEEKKTAGIDYTMTATGTANTYSRKVSLSDGTNYAYIRVVDEAGNEAIYATDVTMLVDTEGPIISFVRPDAASRLSTKIPMTFEIKAIDALSTVTNGTTAAVTLGTNKINVTANGDGVMTGSFTAEQMSALKGSNATLSVSIKDDAGNANATGSLTLSFDNEDPSVTIVNPALSAVNGNITITGTASDNVGLNSVKVYCTVQGESETLLQTFEGTDAYNWKYYDSVNSTNYYNTQAYDGKTITIRVVAEDVAQNTKEVSKVMSVDQDSDRPEIVVTNGSFAGMTKAAPAWHRQGTIYGTVTDDDGVSVLKISSDSGKTWSDNLYSNGAWTYNVEEGASTLMFYVKDSNNTEFTSNNGSNITTSPKISDSAATPATFGYKGTTTLDTNLYIKVDTKAPQSYGAYYRTTDPTGLAKWGSADPTNNGWNSMTQIASDKTLGGPGSKLYVLYIAYDANGISSTTSNIASVINPQGSAESYTETTATQRISGFVFNTAEQVISGNKYLSGNAFYTLSVVTTDNAGTAYTSEYQVNIDNDAPELSFTSHSNGATIYAKQTNNVVIGRSNDASQIFYKTTKSAIAEAGGYTDISAYVSTIGWTITYDGGANTTGAGTYHDTSFANILDTLYGAGTSNREELKDVYIWVYGKDSLGNASTPVSLRLSVDPSGDTPGVKITYPSADETLGGTIRVSGYTEMSTVTEATVSDIYMQIDPDYNGSTFSNDWRTKLNTVINNANTYEPKKSADEMAAALGWKVIDVSTVNATVAQTVPYGIRITGGKLTSWGQTINMLEEFNRLDDLAGSPEERTVALRVYAVSNTNKVSEPSVVSFKINPHSPVFGSWTLEDSNGNVRPYDSSNNWISDGWTLKGSVTHASGIESITVTDNGAGIAFDTTAITNGKAIAIPVGKAKSSNPNAFGTHNIKIIAVDSTQDHKNAQATMTINYDNKAPVLTVTSPASSPASVIQSNGSFTIAGEVREESSGENSQSGFERVAIYFTRELDSKTYVINPMILPGQVTDPESSSHKVSSGTGQNNYTQVKSGSSYVTGFSSAEGMMYKEYTISSVSGKEISLSATPAGIYPKGIVKIQGGFYLIQNISGSDITLDRNVDASSAGKKAYFAMAQIVDHQVNEGSSTDYYGGVPVTNDDGDYMGEKVETKGDAAIWEAYINSLNIPDGDITIHVVALDEAGNVSSTTIDGEVINNRPRIAGVVFATDNNGNGSITEDEKVKFSNLYPYGKDEMGHSVHQLDLPLVGTTPIVTIKGLTQVTPEIVGGNVGVGYSYSFSAGGSKSYTAFASGDNGHMTTYKNPVNDSVRSGLNVNMSLLEMLQNNVEDGDNQTYTLTIWDKTEGKTAGTDSQYATITAKVNVAIKDVESATATVKPFYWNNSTNNSTYFNKMSNGHIELEKDLPSATFKSGNTGVYDLDPKVSGVIKIEGSARDNVQLSTIAISLDGSSYQTFATRNNGAWEFADLSSIGITYPQVNGANAPLSNEVFSNTEGHSVDWTLYYDSSKIGLPTNQVYAKSDVNVRVRAMDKGRAGLNAAKTAVVYTANTAQAESGSKTGSTLTNYYRMDIVPYITTVETTLSGTKKKNPTVNSRSSLGHYPVYVLGHDNTINSGEVIKIYGYNLGSEYISVNSTAISTSKAYSVTVNSIESLNNKNNNNASGDYDGTITESSSYSDKLNYAYNRCPNGDNNNLLTDDVYFDVWQINQKAAVPISGKLEQPVMKINQNNGKIGFAFVNGPLYFSMGGGSGNQNYSNQFWMGSYDFFTSVSFTYDKLGYSYGTAAGGDINSSSADKFQFMTSRWGRAGTGQSGSYGNTNSLRLESIGQKGDKAGNNTDTRNFDKQRIKSPSITTAVHDRKTNVYLAYYDAMNDEIRFKYGGINSTSRGNFDYFQDKETAGDPYTYANSAVSTVQLVAGSGITRTAVDNVTNAEAGEYVSIGVVSAQQASSVDDVVVLVWYDATNRTMWYSYNDSPTTNRQGNKTATGWSNPVAVFENTDYENAGEYCKITVDGDKGVHIAAYDPVNLDLVYAYLPAAKGGITTSASDFTTCIVDSNGVVGSNLTVDVALSNSKPIPYIGYYATSCIRPKYATLVDTLSDGSIDDEFTGSWDISIVPTPSTIEMQSNQHNDIGVGVWKDKDSGVLKTSGITTGTSSYTNTPNGYSSTSNGNVYGNGTSNAVLGYAVKSGASSDSIETAQKR